MLVLPTVSKGALSPAGTSAAQPRTTRPIRVHQSPSARRSHFIQSSGLFRKELSGHGCVSAAAAASNKQASTSAHVAIDSPTSLRAFMQALQGKADSLRALAASFAPQAAAADAETLEKVQHAVKRLKAFVSIGHSLSQSYVRRLGRSVNDTVALRALASHIVRIDVLASSVTAMKRSFECGGIEMGEQLSSLLESVRTLRATATQAEQEAQYLQDNPEAAAQAIKEDAERDAAETAANETNSTMPTSEGTNGDSNGNTATPQATQPTEHATAFESVDQGDQPHATAFKSVDQGDQPHPTAFRSVDQGDQPHPTAFRSVDQGDQPHPTAFRSVDQGDQSHPTAFRSVDQGDQPHPTAFRSVDQGDQSQQVHAQQNYQGGDAEDSDTGVYEEVDHDQDEDEDLESVEGLHNSIQRQRSRLHTLMSRVESLQQLAANLEEQEGVEANVHAAVLQDGKGAGEQNVEALRNAVVELAKLRQMVESDDAALESHDAALGAASVLASTGQRVSISEAPPPAVTMPPEVPQVGAPADGSTVRKVPMLDAVGSGKPHVARRRATVDMYESRHLRAQEENERPRHTDEVSKISERIMHESEALRQQLSEQQAQMEGRPPPTPRTREQVWASARRRRPTGDYNSRRTSEGEARENASSIRRRSSATRLVPPLPADAPPFGSGWGNRTQSTHADGAFTDREGEQGGENGLKEKAWEMLGQDGRTKDSRGQPFVRMRRRSSFEARRSEKEGDEENNRRRRGSVDFSVRGNKAADSDWTSTDPSAPGHSAAEGTDWSATSAPGSSAADLKDMGGEGEPAGSGEEQAGVWGAAKQLFGSDGSEESSSGSKPFVRPKKSRPHDNTGSASGSREQPERRRVVPEPETGSDATGEGFWGGRSVPASAQDQARSDDSYTQIGSSSTPYVHKRKKSVDYATRSNGVESRSVPKRDEPKQPDPETTRRTSGGFWGSETGAAAAAEAGEVLRSSDEYSASGRDAPKQPEPLSTSASSGFWGSDTAAAAAEEAGEVLRSTSYSAPQSQPYVHRRRISDDPYAARRSSTTPRDNDKRHSISDTTKGNVARTRSTAVSAYSEASDFLANSGASEEQTRKAPLVRKKKVPDYSARRAGDTSRRDSSAAHRRSSRTGASSTPERSQADMPASSSGGESHDVGVGDTNVGENGASESQEESSFFGSVSSLRDAISKRGQSHSQRDAPARRKAQGSYTSRRTSTGGGDEENERQRREAAAPGAVDDVATGGGTDWSSDSWAGGADAAGGNSQGAPLPGEPTPSPSVAVRRRKQVDYAARRSSNGERSSARRAPQSHRLDTSAYEPAPEQRGVNEGTGANGSQRETGGQPRGAARYSQGDTGKDGSYDARRGATPRRSSINNGSRNGSSRASVSRYTNNDMSGAGRGEASSTWGGQGASDWGDSSRTLGNGAGGGKIHVRGRSGSYAARRGGGDEENERRGRRRSLDGAK